VAEECFKTLWEAYMGRILKVLYSHVSVLNAAAPATLFASKFKQAGKIYLLK